MTLKITIYDVDLKKERNTFKKNTNMWFEETPLKYSFTSKTVNMDMYDFFKVFQIYSFPIVSLRTLKLKFSVIQVYGFKSSNQNKKTTTTTTTKAVIYIIWVLFHLFDFLVAKCNRGNIPRFQ